MKPRQLSELGGCKDGRWCGVCRGPNHAVYYRQWATQGVVFPEGWDESDAKKQELCPRKLPMGWEPPKPDKPSKPRKDHESALVQLNTDPWAGGRGPKLWAMLHEWAKTAPLETDGGHKGREAWLKTFASRIPCGSCRLHWKQVLQLHPVPVGTSDNAILYLWTIKAHNYVNVKLGKPIWIP